MAILKILGPPPPSAHGPYAYVCGGLTQSSQDGGAPEQLSHDCRQEDDGAHPIPVPQLKRVYQGHVIGCTHLLCEEQPVCTKQNQQHFRRI